MSILCTVFIKAQHGTLCPNKTWHVSTVNVHSCNFMFRLPVVKIISFWMFENKDHFLKLVVRFLFLNDVHFFFFFEI